MEGKLIKNSDGFSLCIPNGKTNYFIASTDGMYVDYKLSLKNCQAIERGYDLDKLSSHWRWYYSDIVPEHLRDHLKNSYEAGFQKALEILGDKKFSEEQILSLFKPFDMYLPFNYEFLVNTQPLQQTEWEVEITEDNSMLWQFPEPKFDADGCIILKRI